MKKFIISVLCALPMLTISLSAHAEDWITEEVLKQLTEIRQELKFLKGEVNTLNQEVKNLTVTKNVRQQDVVSSVELGELPRLGSSDANIVIVEFSEYQCPYCSRHFKQTMPLIKSNYLENNKVQYVKRDFPLSFHNKARGAAIAARCVANQDEAAYWSMNKELLENGSAALNVDNYKKIAEKLKLDIDKYSTCLDDAEIAKKVEEDMLYGQQVGVSGTPAFFIGKLEDGKIVNAKRLVGAQPYSAFSRVVNSLLN